MREKVACRWLWEEKWGEWKGMWRCEEKGQMGEEAVESGSWQKV